MRVLPRLKSWKTLQYRVFVAGVALAYLLVALEIPLPAAIHKDTSQPFPCQDHPCGCQTAEQCWTNCCCFTPEERWAWARDHHVEPPPYAEKPAAKPVEKPAETSATHGWNSVKLRDRDRCVTAVPTKSCCRKEPRRTSCCQTASKSVAFKPAPRRGSVRWGSVLSAWRCQGFQTLWVGIGAVLPVPRSPTWSPDNPPSLRISLSDSHASIVSMAPPAPPPRLSLS